MATVQAKAQFITKLDGCALKFEANAKRNDLRANALERIVGSGLDGDRNVLRKLMDVRIKDNKSGKVLKSHERDQRKGIEAEDSQNYQSISDEHKMNSQTAMDVILQLQRELLAQKDPEGKPLFTEKEAAAEIWTPLMREGIMPETFIPDKHSETAEMLKKTFEAYTEFVQEKRLEDNEKQAKREHDAVVKRGGGIKKTVAKRKEWMANFLDSKLQKYGLGASTKQERMRNLGTAMKAFKFAKLSEKAYATIPGLPTEGTEAIEQLGDQTAGYEFMKGNTDPIKKIAEQQEIANEARRHPKDIVFMGNVVTSIDSALGEDATPELIQAFTEAFDEALNSVAKPIRELMATDEAVFAQTMAMVTKQALTKIGKSAKNLQKNVKGLKKIEKSLDTVVQTAAKRSEVLNEAVKVISAIDATICLALTSASTKLGTPLGDRFAEQIDEGEFVKQAMLPGTKEDPRDPNEIVKAITTAVTAVLENAVSDPVPQSAFRQAASAFKKSLETELTVASLQISMREPKAADIFAPILPAVRTAAKAFLDKEFVKVVQSEQCQKDLAKTGREENKEMEDDYEKVREELQDFERQLMLVDEGGMDMAKQETIEKMLLELKRDRQVLLIVESSANLLRTLGRTLPGVGVAIHNQVIEVTETDTIKEVGQQIFAEEVGGQVTAALNAARLIVQLTVNAIRAAERWMIWYRFKDDVEKAFKARSFLLPAIESFYNNKKEQIAYHTIEDVMLGIQLAASIASTIPEPISMVVGKTLSVAGKLGQATNKLGKALYDEKTISNAWQKTIEAMDNPRNRKAGLQAIHDNILLAAHSVAWAAMKGDAIAAQILRSCKIQPQSLADDQTDAKIIVKYLITYLADTGKGEANMERALSDPEKLKLEWKPQKLELTMANWFTARNRARTVANPKLSDADTKAIDQSLKLVQAARSVQDLKDNIMTVEVDELKKIDADLVQLINAFGSYKPVAPDNSKHVGMAKLVEDYKHLAQDRLKEIRSLIESRGA